MERFENEIWEPVIGFEGHYEVSNYGRVKALRRTIYRNDGRVRTMKEKILQLLDSHGYKSVMLCKEGKGKMYRVHRLVATAFIPNPKGLPIINHKDENKANNSVENLEWCDRHYNLYYRNAIGRMIETKVVKGYGKKAVLQYELNGTFVKEYPSIDDASRSLNISSCTISLCCSGGHSNAGGYQWKIKNDNRVIKNILPIIQMDLNGKEIKNVNQTI